MKEPALLVLPDWALKALGLWPVGYLSLHGFLFKGLSLVVFARSFLNQASGMRLLHCWLHEVAHSTQPFKLKGEAAELDAEMLAAKALLSRGVSAEAIVEDETSFRFFMKFGISAQQYKEIVEGSL